MQLAIRNVDEAWDITAQVQQRVHLDRRLGRAEMRPRKDRQTKIDGRRVERIDRVDEVETQILVDVQSPRLADQSLGQLRVNAPAARLVGIGQRRAPHRGARLIDLANAVAVMPFVENCRQIAAVLCAGEKHLSRVSRPIEADGGRERHAANGDGRRLCFAPIWQAITDH